MGAFEYGGCPTTYPFRRGDANGDGEYDLSDAVSVLAFLFLGADAPRCTKAADTDDSGVLDISDGIYLLSFLFLGTERPVRPFPSCGFDPTHDALTCEFYVGCDL